MQAPNIPKINENLPNFATKCSKKITMAFINFLSCCDRLIYLGKKTSPLILDRLFQEISLLSLINKHPSRLFKLGLSYV